MGQASAYDQIFVVARDGSHWPSIMRRDVEHVFPGGLRRGGGYGVVDLHPDQSPMTGRRLVGRRISRRNATNEI
jgi:hypothetical protein